MISDMKIVSGRIKQEGGLVVLNVISAMPFNDICTCFIVSQYIFSYLCDPLYELLAPASCIKSPDHENRLNKLAEITSATTRAMSNFTLFTKF